MKHTVITLISQLVDARTRCQKTNNLEWEARHTERLNALARNILPSGSGIDKGTTIDMDRSTPDRIVLHMSFHHMDDSGFYDGWTEHTITIRPSLAFGFRLSISGRDRRDIKDYLGQTFDHVLGAEVDETHDKETDTSTFRFATDD